MSKRMGAAHPGGFAGYEPSTAMFTLPPVSILAIRCSGVRPNTPGNMLRKRLALATFCMAGLFDGLGLLVMATL